MDKETIVIVGGGAAGLMAGRVLSKAGQKVMLLEARERLGGRIMPLGQNVFDFPAQGGAEWVHGKAPITKSIIKEAGLTLIKEEGEIWSVRSGNLSLHKSFIQSNDKLKEKLESLTEDISIQDFLEQNFTKDSETDFKNSILKAVQGYDAADPKLMSTFTLRDEWLGQTSMMEIAHDHRIKEGYGALISFLESECVKNGVDIHLNTVVNEIAIRDGSVSISTNSGEVIVTRKLIITVPLPVLKDIKFSEELKFKQEVSTKIGFGNVIKILLKFKTRWWETATKEDLSKMAFLLCNEKFLTWWTQYPEVNNVLTGWMSGPEALNCRDNSNDDLFELALNNLSNIFNINREAIREELMEYKVINWPKDPFARGAYSYTRVDTKDAYEKLAEPYNDQIFFAGEAMYSGDVTATVEGALGSGLETAERVLKLLSTYN